MSVVLFLFGKDRLLFRYPYHNPFEIIESECNSTEAKYTKTDNMTSFTRNRSDSNCSTNSLTMSESEVSSRNLDNNSNVSSNKNNFYSNTKEGKSIRSSNTNNTNNNNVNIKRFVAHPAKITNSAAQQNAHQLNFVSSKMSPHSEQTSSLSSSASELKESEMYKTIPHSSSAISLSNTSFGHHINNNNNSNNNNNNFIEEHYSTLSHPTQWHISEQLSSRSSATNIYLSSLLDYNHLTNEVCTNKANNTFSIYAHDSSCAANVNVHNNQNRKRDALHKGIMPALRHNILTRLYENEEMSKDELRELLNMLLLHNELHSTDVEQEIMSHSLKSTNQGKSIYADNNDDNGDSDDDINLMLRQIGNIELKRPAETTCIGLEHRALEHLLRANPSACSTLHIANVTLLFYRLILKDEQQSESESEELESSEEEYESELEEESCSEEEFIERREERSKICKSITTNKNNNNNYINNNSKECRRRERKGESKTQDHLKENASFAVLVIALNQGDDTHNSLSSFVQCIVNIWCREELRERYLSRQIHLIEKTTRMLEFYDDKSYVEVKSLHNKYLSNSSNSSISSSSSNNISSSNNSIDSSSDNNNNNTVNSRSRNSVNYHTKHIESVAKNTVVNNEEKQANLTLRNKGNRNQTTRAATVNMFDIVSIFLRRSASLLETCKELVNVLETWMSVLRNVLPSQLALLATRHESTARENSVEYATNNIHNKSENKQINRIYNALAQLPDGMWINKHLYLPLRYLLGYTPSEQQQQYSQYSQLQSSERITCNRTSTSPAAKRLALEYQNNGKNKLFIEYKWPHPCILATVSTKLLLLEEEWEQDKLQEMHLEKESELNEQEIEVVEDVNLVNNTKHNGEEIINEQEDDKKLLQKRKVHSKQTLLATAYEEIVGEEFATRLPWNDITTFLLQTHATLTFGTLYRYLQCALLSNIRTELHNARAEKYKKYNSSNKGISNNKLAVRRNNSTSLMFTSPSTVVTATRHTRKQFTKEAKLDSAQKSSMESSKLTSPSTAHSIGETTEQLKREQSQQHYKTPHERKREGHKNNKSREKNAEREVQILAFQQLLNCSHSSSSNSNNNNDNILHKIGSFLRSHTIIRADKESELEVVMSHCELTPLESVMITVSTSELPIIPPLMFLELFEINIYKSEKTDSSETSNTPSHTDPLLTRSNESANTFTWPESVELNLTTTCHTSGCKDKDKEEAIKHVSGVRTSPYLTPAMSPTLYHSNTTPTTTTTTFTNDKNNIKKNSNSNINNNNNKKLTEGNTAGGENSLKLQIAKNPTQTSLPSTSRLEQRQRQCTIVNDKDIRTPLFASHWFDPMSPMTPLSIASDTKQYMEVKRNYSNSNNVPLETAQGSSAAINVNTHFKNIYGNIMSIRNTQQRNNTKESCTNLNNSSNNNSNNNNNKELYREKLFEASKSQVESSSVTSSQHSWTVTHSWKGKQDVNKHNASSYDERDINRQIRAKEKLYITTTSSSLHQHQQHQEQEQEVYEEEEGEEKEPSFEQYSEQERKEVEERTDHSNVSVNFINNNNNNNNNGKYKDRHLPALQIYCVWGEACPFCEALAASASLEFTHSSYDKERREKEKREERAILHSADCEEQITSNNTITSNNKNYNNCKKQKKEDYYCYEEESSEQYLEYYWHLGSCSKTNIYINTQSRENVSLNVKLCFPLLNSYVLRWAQQCAWYEHEVHHYSMKRAKGSFKKYCEVINSNSRNHNNRSTSSYSLLLCENNNTSNDTNKKEKKEEGILNLSTTQFSEPFYYNSSFSLPKERPWFVRPEIYFSTNTSHFCSPLEMYHNLIAQETNYYNLLRESHRNRNNIDDNNNNNNSNNNKAILKMKKMLCDTELESLLTPEKEEPSSTKSVQYSEINYTSLTENIGDTITTNNSNNEKIKNKNNSNNEHAIHSVRLNEFATRNGKTGKIDDAELTIWMTAHADDQENDCNLCYADKNSTNHDTMNKITHNAKGKKNGVKVFIDGIKISNEASEWLQRNGVTLRERLLYEMELAEAIRTMVMITTTQVVTEEKEKSNPNNNDNMNEQTKNIDDTNNNSGRKDKMYLEEVEKCHNESSVRLINCEEIAVPPESETERKTLPIPIQRCEDNNSNKPKVWSEHISLLAEKEKTETNEEQQNNEENEESRKIRISRSSSSNRDHNNNKNNNNYYENSAHEQNEEVTKNATSSLSFPSSSSPSSLISSFNKNRYWRYNKRQLPNRNVGQYMSPLSLESNWRLAQTNSLTTATSNKYMLTQSCTNNTDESATEVEVAAAAAAHFSDAFHIPAVYSVDNMSNNKTSSNTKMSEEEIIIREHESTDNTSKRIIRSVERSHNKPHQTNPLPCQEKHAYECAATLLSNNATPQVNTPQAEPILNALSTVQWLEHMHRRVLPHHILFQCATHMCVVLLWSHTSVELAVLQRQVERMLHHLESLLSEMQYVNQLIHAGYTSYYLWELMRKQEGDHHIPSISTSTGNNNNVIDNNNNNSNNNNNLIDNNSDVVDHPKEEVTKQTLSITIDDTFTPTGNDVHLLQVYELFDTMSLTQLLKPYYNYKIPQIPTPLLLHAVINEISDVLSIH